MPSLAIKYRPKTFDDVVEQDSVKEILSNICSHNDPKEFTNRNFLLIGPAGTGKTTQARIMAHMLNGNDDDSNIIEIDAASHNGTDAMRQLIDQAQAYPIGSTYKVFVLDECHSLTSQSWQILLKTLESPPARSVFIFATTNPEKIPATIISRVQTFQLSKISVDGIFNRLKYVMDNEIKEGQQYTYSDDALLYIAKLANGGMRDSLTLLDKALAYNKDITMENIQKSLGLPHYDEYFLLLNAYASKDNVKIAQVVNDVYNSGINFVKWFEGFHSFVIQIVKYILLRDINQTMIPNTYESKLSKYTTAHANMCIKLARKLMELNAKLKTTSYLQETALTYLCFVSASKKG